MKVELYTKDGKFVAAVEVLHPARVLHWGERCFVRAESGVRHYDPNIRYHEADVTVALD